MTQINVDAAASHLRRFRDGVEQYVQFGAGLDTFARRKPDVASRLNVFEVDQLSVQRRKHERLRALCFGIPPWLRLVPVDFEARASWWDDLLPTLHATGRRRSISVPQPVLHQRHVRPG